MRTWIDIKNEVLGLLFSRTNNGRLVQLDDQTVIDYANEMSDAANGAFRDLATNAVPIIRTVEVDGQQTVSMRELSKVGGFTTYYQLTNSPVYRSGRAYSNYELRAPDQVILPDAGKYTIQYEAYPRPIERDTPDDFAEFELPDDALDCAVYFMAWRIYLDDDPSIATSYLNYYMFRREELSKAYQYNSMYNGGTFVSKSGWS